MKFPRFLRFNFTLQEWFLYVTIGSILFFCGLTWWRSEHTRRKVSDDRLHAPKSTVRRTTLWLDQPDRRPDTLAPADLYMMRSHAYTRLEKFADAMSDFESTRKLNPEYYGNHDDVPQLINLMIHKKQYGNAILIYETLIKDFPDERTHLKEYARFLATAPDVKFRDGKKAAELARKATEENVLEPKRDEYWVLALALAEAGEFEEAEKAVLKAIAHRAKSERDIEREGAELKKLQGNILLKLKP